MNYLIHNGIRDRHNRTQRASNAGHRGMVQFMFKEQARLVRGRPLPLTEDKLLVNLDELRAKYKQGLIYVTLGNQTPFDLETLSPVTSLAKTKKPVVVLDSINNDKAAGIVISKYGAHPPPETFAMPVEPPAAALNNPLLPPVPPPVVQEESAGSMLDIDLKSEEAPKKRDRKR